jgi:hypothetical protein
MKKDAPQDKYDELIEDLKKEKMNWDFENFLEKTEEEEKIIPLIKNSGGGSFPKIYWMAASLILLFSIGLFFKYGTKDSVKDQEVFVQNELGKITDNFQEDFNLAQTTSDTIKTPTQKTVSDSAATVEQKEIDIMDQILPKRGRLKRDFRIRYAKIPLPKKMAPKAETFDYESNYVIINGQKIENEQEAIDLTKYSFRILSENVSKTMAQTDVLNNFNNDY